MTKKIVAPFVRNPYNYDTNAAGDESGLDTGPETTVKQSFKDEVDINTIVRRFGIGYQMPDNVRLPTYGDFEGINNFHQALNVVTQNAEQFELLPADLRAKFDNNPGKFVDFCLDEKNKPQLRELGLLSKEAMDRDDKLAAEAADKAFQERLAAHNKTTQGGDSQPGEKTPRGKT